ncbi:hypothetical protein OSH11_03930 [Kaistia dalseonensis]|uniref:Lipoprotein n=1 Tax=Kaistia dalseonensis TaxID=410840 RepID=A0ABU0H286_9HYPH|nr:hypothetical protein [Kaistia dalseonensis]MCX5493846.1 hypothetical protein [Kaistia dalseonensis]MDQ0436411.1 hypothetical protein [Kaistia dalseonensis]
MERTVSAAEELIRTKTTVLRRIVAPAGFAVLLALAACTSGVNDLATPQLVPAAPPVPVITSDELVGKWGLGSFRNEADLARTTEEARRFCNNPYIITKGPTGGVMMYLADQTQPSEVFVKTAAGRVYIGPPGPAGVIKDRQITSFQNGVMVAAWVDPTVTARYGTMVFVRCPDGTTKTTATPAPAAKPATG